MKKYSKFILFGFLILFIGVGSVWASPAEFCNDNGVKKVLFMVNLVVLFCKIAAPIILMIMGIIDMAKAVIMSDDKALSKQVIVFGKRAVAAVLIFFVPSLVWAFFRAIDGYKEDEESYRLCIDCIFNRDAAGDKCDFK